MTRTLAFAAAAVLLFGLTLSEPAAAQEKGKTTQTGNRNQGKIRPNFVDANGDGICDNNGTGTCVGNGRGTGSGTGAGQRLRLRDGSCGNPAPAAGQPAPRRPRAK